MGPQTTYEEMVLAWGFPGPQQHKVMYTRLKERALRQLARDVEGRFVLSTGIRLDESVRRMRNYAGAGQVYRDPVFTRRVWVNPIAHWSKADCHDYMDAEGLARNPVSDLMHKSCECMCGAYARPGEMQELETWFPDTARYLHDWNAGSKLPATSPACGGDRWTL